MDAISKSEFDALISGAKLLEQDRRGPKVYATRDGNVAKLFRVKRWLSSNLLCPYAVRFKRNADDLAALGVPSLNVTQVLKVPHLDRQLAIYSWLPGLPLRHALRNASQEEAIRMMSHTAVFIARLHEKGVYFRSMHFGNLLVDEADGAIRLIDILDLSLMRKPLSLTRRRRNFQHMIRYKEDRERLIELWNPFREAYRQGGTGANSAEVMDGLLERWHRELLSKHSASASIRSD
jgi:tRNA A-37 threonylcarbamoyl transferase component Bud32